MQWIRLRSLDHAARQEAGKGIAISPCVPVAPRTRTVLAMVNREKVDAFDRKTLELKKVISDESYILLPDMNFLDVR